MKNFLPDNGANFCSFGYYFEMGGIEFPRHEQYTRHSEDVQERFKLLSMNLKTVRYFPRGHFFLENWILMVHQSSSRFEFRSLPAIHDMIYGSVGTTRDFDFEPATHMVCQF